MSELTRQTRETRVRVAIPTRGVDDAPDRTPGAGAAIATGDGFLDHMLLTLARYADLLLDVEATGDMRHHLVEDVAITLGTLLARDVPATCARYGEATVPMDDALVQTVVDVGGRPHFEGRLPSHLYEHFLRSLALNAGWTLHVRVIRGRDRHHVVEAAFKALGLALRQALAEGGAVFSTKGSVRLRWVGEPPRADVPPRADEPPRVDAGGRDPGEGSAPGEGGAGHAGGGDAR